MQPWALGNGPEYPGNAGRIEGPQTLARVTRDSWSTPRGFGPGPDSGGTAGRPRTTLTRAKVSRDIWSTPRALGHGRESPRSSGHPHGPSDQNGSPGRARQNRGPWEPRRCGLGELVDPVRPRTNARVTRFRWSTLQARGTALETPGTAGRHHGPSDKGPRPRTAGRPHGPSGTVPSHPGELFNPARKSDQSDTPARAASTRGPLDPGPSGP